MRMKGIIPQGKPWTRQVKRILQILFTCHPAASCGVFHLTFSALIRKRNKHIVPLHSLRLRINGLGCSLVDNLYSPVDFNSEGYKKWANNDDVSIITGGLVFGEDLERSSGKKYTEILAEITGNKLSPNKNIGGPSIVALINLSQIISDADISIGFYGARADDENGRYLSDKLSRFNIDLSGYSVIDGITPFTDVLSDPSFNNNNGERSFVNYIGVAGQLTGEDIPASFFDADIIIYGGTALTPGIHDDLSFLLKKGKEADCLNFVNTVYDFRNQKLSQNKPWPLVNQDADFRLIDLLIADNEEAVKISGQSTKEEAIHFFSDRGVHSVIITHGSEDVLCFSDGTLFSEKGFFKLPVSKSAGRKMKQLDSGSTADTTGCGDNFAGGVYASTVIQLKRNGSGYLLLKEAAAWGVVSGGFAGLYPGGVYYENKPGDKLEQLQKLLREYREQLKGEVF